MLTYYKLGPYVLELEPRRRVTMNTDGEKVDYFKAEAARTDVPDQFILLIPAELRVWQNRHWMAAR